MIALPRSVLIAIILNAISFFFVLCSCGALCIVVLISLWIKSAMKNINTTASTKTKMQPLSRLAHHQMHSGTELMSSSPSPDNPQNDDDLIYNEAYYSTIPYHKEREVRVELESNRAYGILQ